MDDLITYFWDATHWQWWAIAMVLFSVEVLLPTFFLLWPGIAALIVGGLVYFMPEMTWQTQIILFTVLALIATVGGRRYFSPNKTATDKPNLNQGGKDFIGRKITLDQDIKDSIGRVSLGDTTWSVRLENETSLAKGRKVEVIAVDGATLVVKAV